MKNQSKVRYRTFQLSSRPFVPSSRSRDGYITWAVFIGPVDPWGEGWAKLTIPTYLFVSNLTNFRKCLRKFGKLSALLHTCFHWSLTTVNWFFRKSDRISTKIYIKMATLAEEVNRLISHHFYWSIFPEILRSERCRRLNYVMFVDLVKSFPTSI